MIIIKLLNNNHNLNKNIVIKEIITAKRSNKIIFLIEPTFLEYDAEFNSMLLDFNTFLRKKASTFFSLDSVLHEDSQKLKIRFPITLYKEC